MSKPKKNHIVTPTYLRLTDPIGRVGKNWHDAKKPFRPTAGLTSYEKRQKIREQSKAVKELECEMKAEKEAERKVSQSLSPFS